MARPDNLKLDDQLCFALYTAGNSIIRAYRPLLRELGLTYPQYLVMLVLWEQEPASVGAIAARLDLAGHAITPLVRRLEHAGLVTRRRDPNDQRVVSVGLTAKGRELEQHAAAVQAQIAARTQLCPPEFGALRTGLHELSAHMSEPPTSDPTRPEFDGESAAS